MMLRKSLAALCLIFLATPGLADEFAPVQSQSHFVRLVAGKQLIRMGIALAVMPSGRIEGSAFGTKVTGAWNWNGGYFCRDLYYGEQDLGANCQAVLVSGSTLRFISDHGTGDWADLRLR